MQNKISTLFVGIDIHKETHTLVGANVVCEPLCQLTFNNSINGFREALDCVNKVARKNKVRPLFGLEDTGGNGYELARYLHRQSLPIKSVSPVLVDRNRQYKTHPEKSDTQDAFGIAEVLVRKTNQLPDFTITQNLEFANSLGILVKDREMLVLEQTRLKNKLHAALLRAWGTEYKTICQKNIFGKRAITFFGKYPTAIDFKRTTRPGREKPEWIKNISLDDLPKDSDVDRRHIRRLLDRLRMVIQQIEEVKSDLAKLENDDIKFLKTIKGCGLVTAASVIAYIKDINRFGAEKRLAKYAGISPRKCESGKSKRDITDLGGHSALRRAIKTIAMSQIGRRGLQVAKEYYRKKISEGKTKQQSLKCLMRQNVKIIFRILKEQRPYY